MTGATEKCMGEFELDALKNVFAVPDNLQLAPPEAPTDGEDAQLDAETEALWAQLQQALATKRELQKKVDAHRAQLDEYKRAVAEKDAEARRHDPRYIDFANPTEEQVADAKKHGIDLFDPMVVRELQRLQKEKEFGGEEDDEGDDDDGGSAGSAKALAPNAYT